MTTSSQQMVLTEDEIACLRALAAGMPRAAEHAAVVEALTAKGMLVAEDADRHTLTPAGEHAIDVAGPAVVPGIDS